jgi:hypothetical protein
MAQLNDTIVNGDLRVTNQLLSNVLQVTIVSAPSSSGSATYSVGTNGQVLKSNGETVYWGTDNDTKSFVAINQGTANAGKFLVVNSSGVVTPTAL